MAVSRRRTRRTIEQQTRTGRKGTTHDAAVIVGPRPDPLAARGTAEATRYFRVASLPDALRIARDWPNVYHHGGSETWRTGGLGDAQALRLLGMGEATDAARDAYERIRGAIEAAVGARVTERATSARRVRRFGEEGAEIDTARVAAGDADCWAYRHRLAKRRTFRLALNVGVSCGAGPGVFAAMAGACCAATDALTRRGYGVEVTALFAGQAQDEQRIGTLWTLKEAHAPLDTEALLSLGQPAAFRLVGFAVGDAAGLPWNQSGRSVSFHPTPAQLAGAGVDYCFSAVWESPGSWTQHADGFVSALFGDGGSMDREGVSR